LIVVGLLVMAGGLATMIGMPAAAPAALAWVAMGGALVVLVLVERGRYRSATAERTNALPGPGGGEPEGSPREARFQETGEVFLDPTSGHRMRVLIDPTTGERRYVAEG